MVLAKEREKKGQGEPAGPARRPRGEPDHGNYAVQSHRNEHDEGQACNAPVPAREEGIRDMSPIELTDGKEVKRRDKETNPAGKGNGVEQDVLLWTERGQDNVRNCAEQERSTQLNGGTVNVVVGNDLRSHESPNTGPYGYGEPG